MCANSHHSFRESLATITGLTCASNRVNAPLCSHYWYTATQPDGYRALCKEGALHAIYACPPFDLMDVILPLTEQFASHVAMCLLPRSFFSISHNARIRWLQTLEQEGRLHIAAPSAGDSTTGQNGRVWLLVFRTEAHRLLLLKPTTSLSLSLDRLIA